jgi:hypothetical protein
MAPTLVRHDAPAIDLDLEDPAVAVKRPHQGWLERTNGERDAIGHRASLSGGRQAARLSNDPGEPLRGPSQPLRDTASVGIAMK